MLRNIGRFSVLAAAISIALCGCNSKNEDGGAAGSAPALSSAGSAAPNRSSGPAATDAGADAALGSTARQQAAPEGVTIPAGKYHVGARVGGRVGASRSPFEGLPDKWVELPAFVIDRAETSVAAYRQCIDAGACTPPEWKNPACNDLAGARDNHPVNCVSLRQARAFCAWTGGRLPSEEEWEVAAKWADHRQDCADDEKCLHGREATGVGTCATHATACSEIHGWSDNVAEWVEATFCTGTDAVCSEPIVKGRSFRDTASVGPHVRYLSPGPGNQAGRRGPEEIGFRCAR